MCQISSVDTSNNRGCVWLFGRGASCACNLKWIVPDCWKVLPREEQIALIKKALLSEMNDEKIDTQVYELFLLLLKKKTTFNWHHLFVTTNWDYLLEREIEALKLKVAPKWLPNTLVFHLNGTVEPSKNPQNRSPFYLETDPASVRVPKMESDYAFSYMIWSQFFVVIGSSFECNIDNGLLSAFRSVRDEMPIWNSEWIVVNPDKHDLDSSTQNLKYYLPHSTIIPVEKSFACWLCDGMPELIKMNILSE